MLLCPGDGGGSRLGAFSGDEHLGAGRFGCAGLSAVPLAWPFLTPAVFFVRGFVSVRDFVARCVLVLATLVGGGSLFFSPLVASSLVWVAGFLLGFFSVYPDLGSGLSIFSPASVFCLSAILGLLWGCNLGFFLPLGAGFLLDRVLGDDGRFTPLKTCLAASNCWRSRRFTWPGSPWRCSSSPTPADQEAQRQMGGSKDPGAFPSNSKFCRVLCVSWCPWSLCGAGCVVFFSFSRGLDVILRG